MDLYPSSLKIKKGKNGSREGFNESYRKSFFLTPDEAQIKFEKLKPFLERTRNKKIKFQDFIRIYKIFLIIDGEKS